MSANWLLEMASDAFKVCRLIDPKIAFRNRPGEIDRPKPIAETKRIPSLLFFSELEFVP
jgi:hypothetical protein